MTTPTLISDSERIRIQAQARLMKTHTEKHTFREFVNRSRKGYVWYRHCAIMANVLERVASGDLRNVMFLMPPRHSKTETVCRLFGAYYLHKFPSRWVGLTSYSDEMAVKISRSARRNYEASGGGILRGGGKDWETDEEGGMWAAGAGGTITGKGAHLILIDDIFKNVEEAYSETIRRKRIEWYPTTLYDRREPGAAEIIVNTRWHMKDLIGYLWEEELVHPRNWHIVCMEALKEDTPIEVPPTCTLEPDFRETGRALCPERYSEEDLLEAKAVQKKFFATKYQQRPTLEEGEVWKRIWFERRIFKRSEVWLEEDEEALGEEPELMTIEEKEAREAKSAGKIRLTRVGYDWDCAYTENDQNSASAYVRAGVDDQGNIYVLDVDWRWSEFPEQVSWMSLVGGPRYVEQKASGKSLVQVLKRGGLHAEEVEVRGPDKVSRAVLATPAAEAGKVYIEARVAEKLLDDPRQGILLFPSGPHDDLNDAFVQAINRLYKAGGVLKITAF